MSTVFAELSWNSVVAAVSTAACLFDSALLCVFSFKSYWSSLIEHFTAFVAGHLKLYGFLVSVILFHGQGQGASAMARTGNQADGALQLVMGRALSGVARVAF